MSTEVTWQTLSTSSEETERLGEQLGKRLRGGEVIELISDLGGGKTIFVHGLAHGAGSTDKVASPTFTISREYKTKKITLHHFDFYRLQEAGVMSHELAEALEDHKSVVVVEWADVVMHVLPERRLRIEFITKNENSRKLHFKCPESLSYLVEGLT